MKNNFLKIVLAVLTAIVFSGNVNCQNIVNELVAKEIGKNFIELQTGRADAQLGVFHVENCDDGTPCLYIFNVKNGGFVIVSASKNVKPILAYSDKDSYEGEIPATAMYFIDNYRHNIEYINKVGGEVDEDVVEIWKSLENNELPAVKNENTVDELLETDWDQDCYYNALAPEDYWGPCYHCYAGCVACAMSQVMKYWDHPAKGRGYHSYTHSSYGTLSANFGETYYDWDDMPNEVHSQNDAVATLMYHCGVAVDMNYSPSGSGAQSADVETAMRQYFGYCAASYQKRSDYEDDEWKTLLKDELDKAHPMYFSGDNGSSGHAIVCDGYDNRDYFHFNFGWSGWSNGFYNIDDVGGFCNNETVVMNIVPLPINSDENGIIYVATDGEGDGSSWENATHYLEYASSVAIETSNQIWVKAGTYYGDTISANGAFTIYDNNRIYGGFAGNETPDFNLDDRDFEKNPTILDGMNQRRVLYQSDHFQNSAYSVWDGFTIQNGQSGAGAGAYLCSNSRLTNCKFLNNNAEGFGGAAYIISAYYENASVKFENCTFVNNNGSMGGAICDMLGSNITNCYFRGNSAVTKGGAYYVYTNKQPKFVNCIFAGNSAKEAGAIFNRGKFTMINCDIVCNEATEKCGGLHNDTHYSKIYNTVFWGNKANNVDNQIDGTTKFYNCGIQGGGFTGENIITLSALNAGGENSPYFVDPENGDYNITESSVLIDNGDKSVTGVTSLDILGNPRVVGNQIDLGAIEYQGTTSVNDIVENSFEIYPNPATDIVSINIGDEIVDVEICNALGQIISKYANLTGIISIDVSNFESGIYFCNIIRNGNILKTSKLAVE